MAGIFLADGTFDGVRVLAHFFPGRAMVLCIFIYVMLNQLA